MFRLQEPEKSPAVQNATVTPTNKLILSLNKFK